MAEVLAHGRASTASIAIAESKKQEGEDRLGNSEETKGSSNTGLKILVIVISLILIVLGIGAGYYFYNQSALAPSTPQAPAAQSVPSLIPADSQDVIAIDGLGGAAVLERIQGEMAKPLPSDSITEIIPIETTDGQRARLSTADMLSLMQISPPDILTRSLDSSWMLGVYTDGSGNKSAFVVVTTNFFQNAFAGMLQWESVMADDLKQYVGTNGAADIANVPLVTAPIAIATSTENASTTGMTATSTATTTSVIEQVPAQPASPYAIDGHFEDRIIMNKDVRVFVTDNGNILFLYSFIDNTKLVVAGSEDALKEILTRLENQAFVR